ncbi:MAG: PilZ domain-containing protein [Acidobacteriota bacterium]|nr:PilZ domain-containing protein [Acidobacteriota bacterium]
MSVSMLASAKRPEKRHQVDFPITLSFHDRGGTMHGVRARCVNISSSGARLETSDRLEAHTRVLVDSAEFGRMGLASICYCLRHGMKYEVGVRFECAFQLTDPVRKKILAGLERSAAAE